jgi:hypothetical protein
MISIKYVFAICKQSYECCHNFLLISPYQIIQNLFFSYIFTKYPMKPDNLVLTTIPALAFICPVNNITRFDLKTINFHP